MCLWVLTICTTNWTPPRTQDTNQGRVFMMTSSNGTLFRVTGPLCGEFSSPVTGEFHAQRTVTRSFDVFFDLRPNERLSKRWWCWRLETPSRPLWRRCNVLTKIAVKHDMSGWIFPNMAPANHYSCHVWLCHFDCEIWVYLTSCLGVMLYR